MSCGELLQQGLADPDLMADGTVVSAAFVIGLNGHKKYGEDQGKDQQCRAAGCGQTGRLAHVLLPPSGLILSVTAVLTDSVQNGMGNIQFKAVQLRHGTGHPPGVLGVHVKGLPAPAAGHVKVRLAVRRTDVLVTGFPTARLYGFAKQSRRLHLGEVPIDGAQADLLCTQPLGDLTDGQLLIGMPFQESDQTLSLLGIVFSRHISSRPNLRMIRKSI